MIPEDNEEDLFGWERLSFPDWFSAEPQQLIDVLESKSIFKNNADKWYHPAYKPLNAKGQPMTSNVLGLDIARHAYEEGGLVPLYTVYSSFESRDKPLHSRVLDIIASRRIEELQQQVEENPTFAIELLQQVDPEIDGVIESGGEIPVTTWSKLNAQWVSDVQKYLEGLLEQEPHIIGLEAKEIGRAISIFENINQGGTALNVYDLIVAKAARDKDLPGLTQRIVDIISQTLNLPSSMTNKLNGSKPNTWDPHSFGCIEDNQPANILKYQYLNLLSIVAHCGNNMEALKTDHIKKGKILELKHDQINPNTEKVVSALARAFAFLQLRCGVIKLQNTPYDLMILPIAYHLSDDTTWESSDALDRIEYWYWTSIFGGAYRQAQNDRSINDLKVLNTWVTEGNDFLGTVYSSLLDFQGYSDKNVLMIKDVDNPISRSLYGAILQYILSQQPYDFLPGIQLRLNPWDIAKSIDFVFEEKTYNLSVQDHHIMPLGTATSLGQSSDELRNDKEHPLNSVLNRTLISSKANDLIRIKAPQDYLSYMSTISLHGHGIPVPFIDNFTRMADESDEAYYDRILTNRYNNLKKALEMELDNLKP